VNTSTTGQNVTTKQSVDTTAPAEKKVDIAKKRTEAMVSNDSEDTDEDEDEDEYSGDSGGRND
jgi:hypothetical protein